MSSDPAIDPSAQLVKHLAVLQREAPTKPKWDPSNVESMIDWLEQECGLVVRRVPKVDTIVRELIGAFQRRERVRTAIVGPRGGGKTMLAAAIQLLTLRFYGASWTSIGGSLEQAARLFSHVRAFVSRSVDLQGFITEVLATRITAKNGGCITVHAASEKSIRGQHPRGPSGAGGIALDEAALIEDNIIDAALPQVASASPSIVLQLSTLGEAQSGRFHDLIQSPVERGYRVHQFGIFDVVGRCPFDCATTCPVPAFAKDDVFERPNGSIEVVHRALCAGKAHEPDGWVDLLEIAQQFKDLPREAFQREFLGLTSSRVGAVYNTEDIDAAILGPRALSKYPDKARRRLLMYEKAIGLDWGYSGESCACYLLRLKDHVVVYRWEVWTHTRFSVIREHIVQKILDERIECILPDAANPSDNDELQALLRVRADQMRPKYPSLRDWDCIVRPVSFGAEKVYGIGEVRRRLEQRLIVFPREFNGMKSLHFEHAMRQLKGYMYDKNGRPIKKNEHACDALLCGVMRWAPRRLADPQLA